MFDGYVSTREKKLHATFLPLELVVAELSFHESIQYNHMDPGSPQIRYGTLYTFQFQISIQDIQPSVVYTSSEFSDLFLVCSIV